MNRDYDSIARFYDLAAGWTLTAVRREVARLAAESGAKKLLDVGCGTGLQLLEFERRGIMAVGVDDSKAMLEVACGRLGGECSASLVRASGVALPFAADSFDLSVLSLVLHESAEDPFRLLDEALRVAPRLYALDWGMAERNLDYPARLPVRLVERLAGRRHYASYKEYMRLGALEGLIERYRRARGVKVDWRKQLCLNTMLLMQLERQ